VLKKFELMSFFDAFSFRIDANTPGFFAWIGNDSSSRVLTLDLVTLSTLLIVFLSF
jgi:hypothetical protein